MFIQVGKDFEDGQLYAALSSEADEMIGDDEIIQNLPAFEEKTAAAIAVEAMMRTIDTDGSGKVLDTSIGGALEKLVDRAFQLGLEHGAKTEQERIVKNLVG